MKRTIALAIVSLSCSVSLASTYEQIVRDCLDYGHSKKTESQVKACKESAREEVLARPGVSERFQDCIDYGHNPVSPEKAEQCLERASAE